MLSIVIRANFKVFKGSIISNGKLTPSTYPIKNSIMPYNKFNRAIHHNVNFNKNNGLTKICKRPCKGGNPMCEAICELGFKGFNGFFLFLLACCSIKLLIHTMSNKENDDVYDKENDNVYDKENDNVNHNNNDNVNDNVNVNVNDNVNVNEIFL
jgi:hypothetical protein